MVVVVQQSPSVGDPQELELPKGAIAGVVVLQDVEAQMAGLRRRTVVVEVEVVAMVDLQDLLYHSL